MEASDRDIRLNRTVVCLVVVAILLVLPFGNVPAALSAPSFSTVTIPNKVGFEGYLTDGTGQPISDGAHNLAFRVYSAVSDPPASAAWVETQTITVTTGLYSVLLGSVNTLTTNLFSGDRWVGVTVDAGTEITPRTRVASVPFALNAEHANSAETVDWTGIGNKPADLVTGSGANGQLSLWNGTNTVIGVSGLLYSGNNLSVAGGLNVGNATGATGGQIRASGTVTGSNLSGTNTGDATKAGENYLSLSGQAFTANPVNLSGSNATGTLAAGRFPALTGDVSTSAGSLTTSIGANKVTNSKLATMAGVSLKGNSSGSTGNAADLSVATVNTMLGTVTGSGANTRITYYSGASTVTSNANLTTDGSSVTMSGGLNVNTSGAAAGTIRAAGRIYPNNQAGVGYAANVQTVANNGVAQIFDVPATTGFLIVADVSSGNSAIYVVRGGLHTTSEVSDPDNHFTPTKGSATSINIYWDTTNARYEIQNTTGGTHALYMYILAV